MSLLPSPSPGWTDARVETLITLWEGGLSAAQVARQLGGVTRNAVIGKLHRLGLMGRAKPSAPRRLRPPRSASRPPRERVRPTAPRLSVASSHVAATDEPGLVRDLAALATHICHWPIGDPRATDFSFCGHAVVGAGPYCPDHDGRPHRPGADRLDRDPSLRRLLAGAGA